MPISENEPLLPLSDGSEKKKCAKVICPLFKSEEGGESYFSL